MIAAVLLSAAPLGTLRTDHDQASARAATARAEAEGKAASRAAAERELESLKAEVAAGSAGWLGERHVKQKSAVVRDLLAAETRARRSAEEAERAEESAREALREGLFADASALTGRADLDAKEGRRSEAQAAYAEAVRDLREASELPGARAAADPWKGMEAEIPLEGASREGVAASYRAVADDIAAQLPALEARRDALAEAAKAYARLSEFRGVLERGGTPVPDPAPERDRL
ncbi:MAG TPA: hypothetical protein VMV18_10960, partial [bacterium]|nr:hypothetical protein [bacterium]